MIRILKNIPEEVIVAVSGGPDSMAILDFLSKGPKKVSALHFNHRTPHADEAQTLVENFCTNRKIPLDIYSSTRKRRADESPEEHWRNLRYKAFHQQDLEVITCHHLDDQVENWIMTACHGNPVLIPYRNQNVIRPFLTTRGSRLRRWCDTRCVPYVEDPSNTDDQYTRSYVRHNMMEHILRVNPGIYKTIKKKVWDNLEINYD